MRWGPWAGGEGRARWREYGGGGMGWSADSGKQLAECER